MAVPGASPLRLMIGDLMQDCRQAKVGRACHAESDAAAEVCLLHCQRTCLQLPRPAPRFGPYTRQVWVLTAHASA